MSEIVAKHDIKIGDNIYSDDEQKSFAVFPNPKSEGQYMAKIYKRDGVWMLISDPDYEGGGLIAFLNDYDSKKKVQLYNYIEITKTLPNVVMAKVV